MDPGRSDHEHKDRGHMDLEHMDPERRDHVHKQLCMGHHKDHVRVEEEDHMDHNGPHILLLMNHSFLV